MLGDPFAGVVQNPIDGVGEIPIEGSHFVLGDGILELFQRGLSHRLGTSWVGEVEDVLSEGEVGVLDVLRIGPHVDSKICGVKRREE